jgi:hypothetical protein
MRIHSFLCFFLFNAFALGADTLPLGKKTPPVNGESGSIVAPKKEKVSDTKLPEPGEGKPYVASMGTYGSSRINEVILKEFFGKELDRWLVKGLASDDSAVEMEDKMLARIRSKFKFPFAEWSIIQFFEPGQLALHFTLDVVEESDVARRMPFLPRGLSMRISRWIWWSRDKLNLSPRSASRSIALLAINTKN